MYELGFRGSRGAQFERSLILSSDKSPNRAHVILCLAAPRRLR